MAALTRGGQFPPIGKRDHVPMKGAGFKGVFSPNSTVHEHLVPGQRGHVQIADDDFQFLTNPHEVIAAIWPQIESHLDRRFALFFVQLVSVYRTPYHFEWIEAQDEYGKGQKLKIKNSKGEKAVYSTEAAHSSTMPALMAYPRDAWDAFERAEGPKPEGFVFTKYGHSYIQHNATVEAIRFVNRADCLVDGTHNDSRLRNEAIQIVNKVARGELDLRRAMGIFLEKFQEAAETAREQLSEREPNDPRLDVLIQYLDKVIDVRFVMDGDPGYFDRLMGVKVYDQYDVEKEEALRQIAYVSRYKLIQQVEAIESKIARVILKAQNKMLNKRRKTLKTIDHRLRYTLLEDASPAFTKAMERILCTSLSQLREGLDFNEQRLRSFKQRKGITTFKEKHRQDLDTLKRALRKHIFNIGQAELNYRSVLLRSLRTNFKGWSQQKLADKYSAYCRENGLRFAMSRPAISRMEQRARMPTKAHYETPESMRRIDVDLGRGCALADVFSVDKGLIVGALQSFSG